MLVIENLDVKIKDKLILDGFNLSINDHEIHAVMGPNGTGKSTLAKVIMGDSNYSVTNGSIIFKDVNITDLNVLDRAKMGIFLSFQNPLKIEGVTNSEFLRSALMSKSGNDFGLYDFILKLKDNASKLFIGEDLLHRSVNCGFSGGEIKKNEILQMKMLSPSLIILDELDSGLDVDSLKIVCSNIMDYYNNNNCSILIITHYPRILELINPNFVHIMKDGKIVKTGDMSLAYSINNNGYAVINEVDGN